MCYLVGGYYDNRIFKGEHFEGKTPFTSEIEIYTIEKAEKLNFVDGVEEEYQEILETDGKSIEWDDLSNVKKGKFIEKYTESDEIAGLVFFEKLKDAEKYKDQVLKEVEEIKNQIKNEEIIYLGKVQDKLGFFQESYIHRYDYNKG